MNRSRAVFYGLLACWGFMARESNAQWTQALDLPGGSIHDYCSLDSHDFLVMDGRIFQSDNDGATWKTIASPRDGLEVSSLAELDGTILAGTAEGVYQSPPHPISWKLFERPGLPKAPALSIWTYLGYLYIGSVGAVYKSIDNGKSWDELQTGLPQDARITCFAGIVKIAVAGTENRGVFISEAKNWVPSHGFDSTNQSIRDLDVIGNKVYAVSAHEIMESENLGDDWRPSSSTLANVTCLLGSADHLFAGTERGLHHSIDKGKTWESLNEGFPENSAIRSLVEWDRNILASTDKGVWRIASPTSGMLIGSQVSLPIPHRHGRQTSPSFFQIISRDPDGVPIRLVDYLGRRIWAWK